MKKIFKSFLWVLLILLLYLLFFPVDIDPVAYTPPTDPGLEGDFAKNDLLKVAKQSTPQGIGPEDIAISKDSVIYTGLSTGEIVRWSSEKQAFYIFAETGGRPLGMEFDANGNLIVADEFKGLLSVSPQGEVSVLTNEVDGTKIFFADDLDIASDGMIYFSDASQRNHDVQKEVWELQPTGRLLSYNPNTKITKVEFEGMRFANGVAIGPNDEYLLVTETFGLLIHKYFLKGNKKGTKEIFTDQLPGFPDNITYNDDGIFWVAMPDLRIPELEILYKSPFLRKIVRRLPSSVSEGKTPEPYGLVVGFDTNGKVVHNFQDPEGKFHAITSATEFDGKLFLGSLRMNGIGLLDLKK